MHPTTYTRRFLLMFSAVLVGTQVLSAQTSFDSAVRTLALDEPGQAALARGDPVVKVIQTPDKRAVLILGMIKATEGDEVSLETFRRVLKQDRNETVAETGHFGSPAVLDDLSRLRVEGRDIDALRICAAASCKIRVTNELLASLEKMRQSDMAGDLIELEYKKGVAQFVANFQDTGIVALNGLRPTDTRLDRMSEHLRATDAVPFVFSILPELREFLISYPSKDDVCPESIFDWSKVKIGLKLVLVVTQTSICSAFGKDDIKYAIVTRQLYASRYVNDSIAVILLIRSQTGDHIVFASSSRSDALGGLFGGVKRGATESEAANKVRILLEQARDGIGRQQRPGLSDGQQSAQVKDVGLLSIFDPRLTAAVTAGLGILVLIAVLIRKRVRSI